MPNSAYRIKSVGIIGAGAAGEPSEGCPYATILLDDQAGGEAAAALKAEACFDRIRVFERRECAGGT